MSGTDQPHIRVSFAIAGASQSVYAIDPATVRKLAETLISSAAIVEGLSPAPTVAGAS